MRQRLISLAVGAFVTALALSGITVILPLYATQTLGMTNAAFAKVLSLRMTGITVGVILLGALSDRFGNKRLTLLALAVGGALYALLGLVPVSGFLVLIPVVSGLLSTAFVNLNHLTQIADLRRQGRANTLYRAAGTLAGIAAPIITTRFFGQLPTVFVVIGVVLCLGALAMRTYPLHEPRAPFAGWAAEFRGLVAMYASAMRQRQLMRFVHLSLLWGSFAAAVGTFIAIRMTTELGASRAAYGNTCSIASALTLLGILMLGAILDRTRIKALTVGLFGVTSASIIVMGVTSSVAVVAASFVVYTVAGGVAIAPLSMWISRDAGGCGLSTAFAVQKVLSAVYLALANFAFGLLEPALGIRVLLLICGLLTVPVLALIGLLREPGLGPAGAAIVESPAVNG